MQGIFNRQTAPPSDDRNETLEKCSILFTLKKGNDFNLSNTLCISQVKI